MPLKVAPRLEHVGFVPEELACRVEYLSTIGLPVVQLRKSHMFVGSVPQVLAPLPQMLPVLQLKQLEDDGPPIVGKYRPAAQPTHPVDPVFGWNLPAKQLVQKVADPKLVYMPAAQLVQESASNFGEKKPTPQVMHAPSL